MYFRKNKGITPKRFVFHSLPIGTLFFIVFLVNSCKHDGIPPEDFPEICFQEQIIPIFQNSCASCHNSAQADGGHDFSTYTAIMKAITPGNADKSEAYKAITSTFQIMPPNNPLPEDKRILIRLWIEQGAKQTNCGTSGTLTNTTTDTQSGVTWACFTRDIQPILMSSCAISGCHDATTHKEGYDFSTYIKTLNAVKAGSPTTSKLYRVITASPGSEDFMPPKPYSALSKAATDSIYSWIKKGALNEQCAAPCDTTGTITYSGKIKPIIDLYCTSCHSGTSPSGGIKLATASDVQTVAKSGKLLGAVKRQSGYQAMPPTYALSTCDVREIALWINQGYN
jgi:uncharacterized membrane protein